MGNKSNNTLLLVLLVLFIILTMVLGGFIVYDKVINKNSKAQDNENNKAETNDENLSVEVISAFDKKTYFMVNGEIETMPCDPTTQAYISLKIPKINLQTEGALALNDKIISKYQSYVELVNKTDHTDWPKKNIIVYDLTYDYKIKNSIVYINMKEENVKTCGSGSGMMPNSYVYDIKKDKELSIIEVLEANNIDINTAKGKIKQSLLDCKNKMALGYNSIDDYNNEIDNIINNIDLLSYDYFYIKNITDDSITIVATSVYCETVLNIN